MRAALALGFVALVLLVACSGPAKTSNDEVQVTNQEMQDAGLDDLNDVDAALAELDDLDAELNLDDELAALDEDLQLE